MLTCVVLVLLYRFFSVLTGNDPWYPDWQRTSTCANDGLQPNWMGDGYFTSSQSECCAAWFWWQDGISSSQNCMDA